MTSFDVGVAIPTHKGAIVDVCGRIDSVRSEGSLLADRGVYTPQGLGAEYWAEFSPEAYENEIATGYISGMVEEASTVISLNMRAVSACVMEFIARAYPFRQRENSRKGEKLLSAAMRQVKSRTQIYVTKKTGGFYFGNFCHMSSIFRRH